MYYLLIMMAVMIFWEFYTTIMPNEIKMMRVEHCRVHTDSETCLWSVYQIIASNFIIMYQ